MSECHECAHPVVEYKAVALDADGISLQAELLACGDGECVLQAIANLYAHNRPWVASVVVYEWLT